MVGAGGDLAKLGAWAHGTGVEIMLATFYVSSVGNDLCLAANGYFAKPFERFQIVSVLERFVKNRGRLLVVSPEKEEARNLQVLLGAEKYDVTVYADGDKAVRGREKRAANGVVIGSFPQLKLESLFNSLMGDARIRVLPTMLRRNRSKDVDPMT